MVKPPVQNLTNTSWVYDPADDERACCPEGVTRMDRNLWRLYVEDIRKSDGFDIKNFPGLCDAITYVPVNFDEDLDEVEALKEMATLATQMYNTRNRRTKYDFVKLEKAIAFRCAGYMYYITFQAKERKQRKGQDPAVRDFQARVWDRVTDEKVVEMVRLKNKRENVVKKEGVEEPRHF